MKGLVFREFANMVERELGEYAFDDLVEGVTYQAVGPTPRSATMIIRKCWIW